jgi:hypothetical protein
MTHDRTLLARLTVHSVSPEMVVNFYSDGVEYLDDFTPWQDEAQREDALASFTDNSACTFERFDDAAQQRDTSEHSVLADFIANNYCADAIELAPLFVIFAAKRFAEAVGVEAARDALDELNALRERHGKMPACGRYGTPLF